MVPSAQNSVDPQQVQPDLGSQPAPHSTGSALLFWTGTGVSVRVAVGVGVSVGVAVLVIVGLTFRELGALTGVIVGGGHDAEFSKSSVVLFSDFSIKRKSS